MRKKLAIKGGTKTVTIPYKEKWKKIISSKVDLEKAAPKTDKPAKSTKINMSELAKKSIKETELQEDIFLDSVRSKIELSEADETVLVNVASETFNEVLEEYRDRILSNKFKTRKASEKKKLQKSRILKELYSNG